jgi:uncharacterized UPF0146 family protein
MGHAQLAGKVSEQVIAGDVFLRIDIPKTEFCPQFTKYHSAKAIYSITPVDQEYATKMAEKIQARPVNNYNHHEVIQELVREKIENGAKELPAKEWENEDEHF